MNQVPSFPGIFRFGQTRSGDHVERIVLRGGGLTAALLSRGVTLQGLWLDGIDASLTLGLPDIAAYEAATSYLGALVGPVANRIAGASVRIAGRRFDLPRNDGEATLHSGPRGLHARIWRLAEMSDAEASFTLDLPQGDGGLPGNRRLQARYSLPGSGILRLEVSAQTDAPTPVSIAQHAYWNLDAGPDWSGHQLQVQADHWLPVDDQLLPTGEIRPVTGDMDLRQVRPLSPGKPALDTNFCLSDARRDLTAVARLIGRSGLEMRLWTTEPGLQVYDGRFAIRPDGPAYEGIALEPQGWPDAVNQPGFPSVILQPGDGWLQVTEWHFAAARD